MHAFDQILGTLDVVLLSEADQLNEDCSRIEGYAARRQEAVSPLHERIVEPGRDMAVHVRVRARYRRGGALPRPRTRQATRTMFSQKPPRILSEGREEQAMGVVPSRGFRPVDIEGDVQRATDLGREIAGGEDISSSHTPNAIGVATLSTERHQHQHRGGPSSASSMGVGSL